MQTGNFQKNKALNEAMDKADGVCGFAALVQVLREAHVLSNGEVERVVQLKDEYLQKYVGLNEQLIRLLDEPEENVLDCTDPVVATLEKFVALRLMSPMRVADYKETLVKVREGKAALANLPDKILKMDDPQAALDMVDEIADLGLLNVRDAKGLKAELMKVWETRDKPDSEGEDDVPR